VILGKAHLMEFLFQSSIEISFFCAGHHPLTEFDKFWKKNKKNWKRRKNKNKNKKNKKKLKVP